MRRKIKSSRPVLQAELLEPRILFSAESLIGDLVLPDHQLDAGQEPLEIKLPDPGDSSLTQAAQSGAEEDDVNALPAAHPPINEQAKRHLILIDEQTIDYRATVGILLNDYPDTEFEVIPIFSSESGLSKLNAELAGDTVFDAIHLISPGQRNTVQLGVDNFNPATSAEFANRIPNISTALSADGTISFYSSTESDVADGGIDSPTGLQPQVQLRYADIQNAALPYPEDHAVIDDDPTSERRTEIPDPDTGGNLQYKSEPASTIATEAQLTPATKSSAITPTDHDRYAASQYFTDALRTGLEQDPALHDSDEQYTSEVVEYPLTELVVVDSSTPNYQMLLDDLYAQQGTRTFEVVIVEPHENGIEKITESLADYSASAIHIISHAHEASVLLGSATLNTESFAQHAEDISVWQHAMQPDADILFYGCNLAASEAGRELMDQIAAACDCDVAASDDTTGHSVLGGNWELEYVYGEVQSDLAFTGILQQDWLGTLGTVTVTTFNDVVSTDANLTSVAGLSATPGSDGVISLREAIMATNAEGGGHTIALAAGTYQLDLVGDEVALDAVNDLDIDISSNITIEGVGAEQTVIEGNMGDIVFEVRGGNLTLSDLTVTGGDGNQGGAVNVDSGTLSAVNTVFRNNQSTGDGGAIHARAGTLLDLYNVSVINNTSVNDEGGGIFIRGDATLTNVTVSGNSADKDGGGILINAGTDTVNIDHATITNNTGGEGDGIRVRTGNVTISNSIIVNNGNADVDINTAITSSGNNIIKNTADLGSSSVPGDMLGIDPDLAPLQMDSATGLYYHEIANTSIAFGNAGGSVATDQLGQARDASPDIGAFEAQASGIPIDVNSNLEHHYRFDLDSGLAVLTDSSGNNRDGTWTNNNTGYSSAPTAPEGIGAQFDETDPSPEQYADVANSYNLGSGDFTISLWYKADAADFGVLVEEDGDNVGGDPAGYVISLTSGGDIQVLLDDGNGGLSPLTTTAVTTDTWTSLVVIRSGDEFELYQDGALMDSVTDAGFGSLENSGQLTIGATDSGTNPFEGQLDDVRIYSRALAVNDIAALSHQTPGGPGLVAHYAFDEGSGAVAVDSAGYGNDGAFVNAPAWNVDAVAGSNSLDFSEAGSNLNNSFVEVPNASSLQFGEGPFSVSLWYNIDSNPPSHAQLLGTREVFASSAGFNIHMNNSGAIALERSDGSATYFSSSGNTGTADGGWHHLVFTTDASGSVEMYIDGVDQNAFGSNAVVNINSTNPLRIGASSATNGDFEGALDEVLIYNKTLTAADVSILHADAPALSTNISSGIELNTDGGNDAYLLANPVTSNLSATTVEIQFASTATAGTEQTLLSYNIGSSDELIVNIDDSQRIELGIADASVLTTGSYAAQLLDGEKHSIAFTWDNTSGYWALYLDGQFVESNIGLAAGSEIGAGGTLVLGQEQDAENGLFNTSQAFSGTLYDVLLWNEARTTTEIAFNHKQKINTSNLPVGLLANWQMNGFNGANEVVDVVSGNNLSIGHAADTGFTASTAVGDLHVAENATNGTSVGYAVAHSGLPTEDLLSDGGFREVDPVPAVEQNFSIGQSIGDWTVAAGSIGLIPDFDAPNGSLAVDLSGAAAGTLASASFATEAGTTYQIRFAVDGNFSGGDLVSKDFRVAADGTSQDFVIDRVGTDWRNGFWEYRVLEFTATTNSTTLSFESLETNGFGAYISDIRVTTVPNAITTIEAANGITYDGATGKFYRLVSTPAQFDFALTDATSSTLLGVTGQLATSRSAYENGLIQGFAATAGDDVWLGAHDRDSEGNFYWLEGTTPSRQFWTGGSSGSAAPGHYVNFQNNPDNFAGNQDEIVLMSASGRWDDRGHNISLPYVIEWNANDVLSSTTFTLSDNANGRFAINPGTGEVTVADGSQIDFESATSHSVIVDISNTAGDHHSEVMTINVDNTLVPRIVAPATSITSEDTAVVYSGTNVIQIDDEISADVPTQVQLSVISGTLTLNDTTNVTFIEGVNGASSFVIEGIESDINAALSAGLNYQPVNHFNGNDVLQITTAIAAGLEGLYTFEGGNANDQSAGNANNGTFSGNATTITDAERGEVLSLDGNGDYVSFSGAFGTQSVTLAAWVNLTSPDTSGAEVLSLGDNVGLRLDRPNLGGESGIVGHFFDGTTWLETGSGIFIAGTGWHHVAYTIDELNNVQRIYLDGIQVAETFYSGTIDYGSPGSQVIGRHGSGLTDYDFNGLIDDARIYGRAISVDEVGALTNDSTVASGTVAITINPVNDLAIADLDASDGSNSLDFVTVFHGAPVFIANSDAFLSDVESTDVQAMEVILTNRPDGAAESLTANTASYPAISSNYDSGTGVLSISGTGTLSDYDTILRSIEYNNSTSAPDFTTRVITVRIDDGGGFGVAATSQVLIGEVGDAFWISTQSDVTGSSVPGLASWTERDIIEIADPNLALDEGDGATKTSNGTFSEVVDFDAFAAAGADNNAIHVVKKPIMISGVPLLPGDVLFSPSVSGITYTSSNSFSSDQNNLYAFKPDSVGDYSSGTFHLIFDASALSISTINAFTLVESDTTIGGQTVAQGDFLYADGNNDIHWFDVSTGTDNSELIDGLSLGIGADITGIELVESSMLMGGVAVNSGDILITIASGDGSIADNGLAVATTDIIRLQVTGTGNGTTTGTASILFQGADVGMVSSERADALAIVVGNPINTPPVVADFESSALSYRSVDGPVSMTNTVTVSDPDSSTLTEAIVRLTAATYVNGEDELAFADFGNISGSWIPASGELQLTGVDSLANYELALRSFTYENTSASPSTQDRTIEIWVNDGQSSSQAIQRDIVYVTAPGLWFSSANAVSGSAAPGLSDWDSLDVVQIGEPSLALENGNGTAGTSDGTFSEAVDFEAFTATNDINAIHYVQSDITSASGVDLQPGDLLFSTATITSFTSTNSLYLPTSGIHMFRPDLPNDYSSGLFFGNVYASVAGFTTVNGFTLVESDTTVGGQALSAGDYIYVDTAGTVMWHDLSASTNSVFIDPSGIVSGAGFEGIELVEVPQSIGGMNLNGGTVLATFNANGTAGDNNIAVTPYDVVALELTSTGNATTAGVASILFDGSDVGLGAAERFDALTLMGFSPYIAANAAPVLSNAVIPQLTTITENEIGNAGQTVASILASAGDPITDADGDPEGIAIITNNEDRGTWQYSTDSGTNWLDVGSVDNANALLLRETDMLRMNPDGIEGFNADFTFRAWDQSDAGTAGTKVDASLTGADRAFSSNGLSALINVTDIDENATFINLNNTPTFVEGGSPVVLDGDVAIVDEELQAGDFSVATFFIQRSGGSQGEDVFSATGNLVFNAGSVELGASTIGAYNQNSGNLTIYFNGNATSASVNEALQSIAYSNSSGNPPSSVLLEWGFWDGNGSRYDYSTVNVDADDTPAIDLNGAAAGPDNALSYPENTAPLSIAPLATVNDFGDNDITSLTVSVNGLGATGRFDLTHAVPIGVGTSQSGTLTTLSYVWDGTSSLTVQNNTTPGDPIPAADVQDLIRRLRFFDTTETPTAGDVTFDFIATDSASQASTVATATVTVEAVNDAPEYIGTTTVTQPFINEIHYDNIGTDSDEAIEIAGPAGFDLSGWALVRYNGASQLSYGTDSLAGTITDQGNGFGTVLVTYPLNGLQNGAPDGVALVNDLGQVVQFLSWEGQFVASDGPAAGMTSEDIGVTENDSTTPDGTSMQLTDSGWVTEVVRTFGAENSGQDFAALGGDYAAQTIAEELPLVFNALNGNLISIDDVDVGTSELAMTIQVNNGTITLGSTTGLNSLTGNGTATLVFAGTLADINAALNGLSYTSNTDFNGVDTLTLSVDDQGNTGSGGNQVDVANMSITVTPVNDAPMFLNTGSAVVYNENSNSVFPHGSITVADIDSADFDGGQLQASITTSPSANGWLRIIPDGNVTLQGYNVLVSGTLIGSYQGGHGTSDLVITLNANANATNISEVAQRIAYANTSDNPATPDRTIEFTLDDGDGASSSAASNIVTVFATGDGPIVRDDYSALDLNGIDSYIAVADDASLQMTNTMTMEAWFTIDSLPATNSITIINKEGEYEFGLSPTGQLLWGFANTDPGWSWYDTGYTLNTGTWTHVAISYDNGLVNTYVNGTLVDVYYGSGSIGDAHPTMDELRFGNRENNPAGKFFDGHIDSVHIFDTARTQAEIQSGLNVILPASTAGLVGSWSINEQAGTLIVDLSSAGNHGTLIGGGLWTGYSVPADSTLSITAAQGVLANDFDLDGDVLTIVSHDPTGVLGSATILTDGGLLYDPGGAFDSLAAGQVGYETLTYTVEDGNGNQDTATVRIQITGVNDAATIANLAGDAYNYSAGEGPVVIEQNGDVIVTDPDSTDFNTGSLSISIQNGSATEDALGIRNQGTNAGEISIAGSVVSFAGLAIGTVTGGSGGVDLVVTFNASATEVAVEALIENITFENTNATAPFSGSRQISFMIDDGDGGVSYNYDATINLIQPFSATVLDRFGSTAFNNNDGSVNWSGPWQELGESNGSGSGEVFVSAGTLRIGNESLFSNSITGVGLQRSVDLSSALSATLTIDHRLTGGTGTASVALSVSSNGTDWTQINTFNGGSGTNSNTPISTYSVDLLPYASATTYIRLEANGSVGSLGGNNYFHFDNIAIDYTTNVPPILTLPGTQIDYTENDGAVVIDSGITVADDAPNFGGGQLTVGLGTTGQIEDRLAIRDQGVGAGQVGISGTNVTFSGVTVGTISGGTNGSSPLVVTFNGFSIPGAVEAIARNITYENVSEDPITTNRDVIFTLTDSDSASATPVTETITINAVNDDPVATADNYTVVEDDSLTTTPANDLLDNDYDIEGDTLTVNTTAIAGPTNGALSLQTDGTFTYTPAADFAGTDTFTYEVSDTGGATSQAIVSIAVEARNDEPMFTGTYPGTLTVAEDSGFTSLGLGSVTFSPGGSADEASQTLTYSVTALPTAIGDVYLADGTTLVTAGAYTLTDIQGMLFSPAINQSGTGFFRFAAIDDGGTAYPGENDTTTQGLTINVTPVNDIPTSAPVTLTPIAEDSGFLLITQAQLLANANDIEGEALTATGLAITAGGGTLLDNSNGTWSYTPATDDDSGASFSYRVTDGTDQTSGIATVDIIAVNDAPTTTPVSLAPIAEDSGSHTITQALLLSNATDIEGDALTVSGVVITSGNGTVVDNGGGTWSYTPATNDDTSVSLSYDISDGSITVNGTATLDITPVNDAPVTGGFVETWLDDLTPTSQSNIFSYSVDSSHTESQIIIGGTQYFQGIGLHPDDGTGFAEYPINGATNFSSLVGLNEALTSFGSVTFRAYVDNVEVYNSGVVARANTAIPLNIDTTGGSVLRLEVDSNGSRNADHAVWANARLTGGAYPIEVSIAESASDTAFVATYIGKDPDADLISYSLSNDAAGRFAINAITGEITVADASLIDRESATVHQITVAMNDGSLTTEHDLFINISDLDEPPTTSTVILNPVPEDNGPLPITQTDLLANATDQESATLTATGLAISTGNGVLSDNGDGSWAYLPAANDDTDVSFTYSVTDGTTSVAGTATLDLLPVNDAPQSSTVVLPPIAEDSGSVTIVESDLLINATDIDADPLSVSNLAIAPGSSGSLVDNGDGTWDYTPAADNDTQVDFTYLINDGQLGVAATAILDITPVNDVPVVDLDADNSQTIGTDYNTLFTVADGPVAIADGALVEDIDSQIQSLTVELTNRQDSSSEQLGYTTPDLMNVSIANDVVIFTASGSTTNADFAALVNSFTYNNTSTTLDITTRIVTFVANDGSSDSQIATARIAMLDDSTAPTLTNNTGSTVNEGGTDLIQSAELSYTDDVQPSGSINYTVDLSPGNGYLAFASDTTTAIQHFSQTDIDTDNLVYVHDESETTTDSFTFTVGDGQGNTITGQLFQLAVVAQNDTPQVTTPAGITVIEDSSAIFTSGTSIVVSDAENGTVEVTLSVTHGRLTLSETSGVNFTVGTGSADATMTFSGLTGSVNTVLNGLRYTPDTNFNGPDTLTLFTSDLGNAGAGGVLTDLSSTTIDVIAVNDQPTASSVTLAPIQEDDSARIITEAELLANAVDVDGDTLFVTELAINSGTGVLTDNLDGSWSYTPDPNDDSTVGFTYNINDSDSFVVTTATLDITPVNDIPGTAPVTLPAIVEDSGAHTITQAQLLANASDIEGDFLLASDLLITDGEGTLINNGDGTWNYSPAANDHSQVSYRYTITDGTATIPATATLDIIAVNDPPTGQNGTISIPEDSLYTFGSSDFGYADAVENHSWVSITITSLPDSGQVNLDFIPVNNGDVIAVQDIVDGKLEFIPAQDSVGNLGELGFQVKDDGGTDNSGVDLDIQSRLLALQTSAANDAPVLEANGAQVDEGSDNTITPAMLSANDVDNIPEELVFTLTRAPTNGELLLNGAVLGTNEQFSLQQLMDAQLRYVHDGSETSTDFFDVSVVDADQLTPDTGRFSLIINEVIDPPPQTDDDGITVRAGGSFDAATGNVLDSGFTSLLVNGNNETESLTIEITQQPAYGALTLNPDGTFKYDHEDYFDDKGAIVTSDSFVYRVINEDGVASVATVVNITVELHPAAAQAATESVSQLIEVTSVAPAVETEDPPPEVSEHTASSETDIPADSLFDLLPAEEKTDEEQAETETVVAIISSDTYANQSGNLSEQLLKKIEVKKHKKLIAAEGDFYQVGLSQSTFELIVDIQPTRAKAAANNPSFLDGLNNLVNDLESEDEEANRRRSFAADLGLGASFSVSAGALAWALRGGVLFSAMASSAPLWSQIDPLRVMASGDPKSRDEEEDSVEDIFEESK